MASSAVAVVRNENGAGTAVAPQQLQAFTRDQVELLKRTVAQGTTDDEFRLFVHVAMRSGLDPFARQIHAIKRDGRMTIQTGIDGYRLVADRTGCYAPGRAPTYEYDAQGNLVSATAYVQKLVAGTWHEVAATAFWAEYFPGEKGFMWKKMPHVMLAKCAEALALRRAFPAELSGVYTSEEMDQANAGAQPAQPQPATEAQIRHIERLAKSHVFTAAEKRRAAKAVRGGMTREQASDVIEWLQANLEQREAAEKAEAEEAEGGREVGPAAAAEPDDDGLPF